MNDIVSINELRAHVGSNVRLQGWLSSKRSGGKIVFLVLRDGTGMCQCIVEATSPDAFEIASDLERETSLWVEGQVREEARAPGGYEIAAIDVGVIGESNDFPIAPKAHGIDFLMSHRHLWLRSSRPAAIMRIRHTVIDACRRFFDERGFTLIDTPILSPGVGEDTQTLFPVDYFGDTMYLAQTGQLYLESACMALGKVYCFGPTFRAEKSKTRRHLTEFWMLEPEVAFAQLDDIIVLAEDLICACLQAVLASNQQELQLLERDLEALRLIHKPFVRLTYSETAEILRSKETRERLENEMSQDRLRLQDWIDKLQQEEERWQTLRKPWQQEKVRLEISELREQIQDLERDLRDRPKHIEIAQSFEWGKDLGGSDETIISRSFEQPVFVTHYPFEAKAFYMKRDPSDSRIVFNVDLLAPEGYGEIIGGSQREDDMDALMLAIEDKGLNADDYDWYLDLRRYGSVPHGGFGLGIERLLSWICGLKHVRETIPFPRTMGRVYP